MAAAANSGTGTNTGTGTNSDGKTGAFSGFKIPKVNTDAILDSYKKNLEILGLMNKMSTEVCNGVVKLQSALIKQLMSDVGNLISSRAKPSEAMAKLAEIARDCTVKIFNDGKEISQIISANNNELTATIAKRFKESIEASKQSIKK
ncbi:MAG: TIGR01841 family phasin [Holosporaceae bacterium]|nr:TIGR01841 family phasin [Holosporaceae bacterium]